MCKSVDILASCLHFSYTAGINSPFLINCDISILIYLNSSYFMKNILFWNDYGITSTQAHMIINTRASTVVLFVGCSAEAVRRFRVILHATHSGHITHSFHTMWLNACFHRKCTEYEQYLHFPEGKHCFYELLDTLHSNLWIFRGICHANHAS